MARELEQFALAVEHTGTRLPSSSMLETARRHAKPHKRHEYVQTVVETVGRITVNVAPGIRYRCPATCEAVQRLAARLRQAKLPKRDRRPTKGGLTETEIETRAIRYAAFLQANGQTTVTLWPLPGRRCDQVRFECALLGRLTGFESAGRAAPESARQLARKAEQEGYTIRYADPEGINPPCTY